MEESDFNVFDLEKHETKDINDGHINGNLTVIWRNWDKIIKDPEMVYLNTVNPGEIKGPHIHKNRTSYFFCISGTLVLIIKDKNGTYHEIKTNSADPKLISVSNGIAAAILNPSDKPSQILVLADISWKPNDDEMKNTLFTDYNWKKWK